MTSALNALICPFEWAADWLLKTDGGNLAFVGMPQTGKTVFFACAMDALQRHCIAHQRPYWHVQLQPDNMETQRAMSGIVRGLGQSKWPERTQIGSKYEFVYQRGVRNLLSNQTRLCLHDYGGEAYRWAFADSATLPPDGGHQAQADKLKQTIKDASGIFLLIDTTGMQNGFDAEGNDCLFNLCKFIQNQPALKRLALVFTKKDLFDGVQPPFDPVARFKEDYPTAWGGLRREGLKFRTFWTSSVGRTVIDEESGRHVPTSGFKTSQADGILESVLWMLG